MVAAACLLLGMLWIFRFFFLSLQFHNLKKSTEVYLTWSNLGCVLLWAVLFEKLPSAKNHIGAKQFLWCKDGKRISPYTLFWSSSFVCFLNQPQLRCNWCFQWVYFDSLDLRCKLPHSHVCTPPVFLPKGCIWTAAPTYQRSVGWAVFSNPESSYWRVESAGQAISTTNPFPLGISVQGDSFCVCQHCAG